MDYLVQISKKLDNQRKNLEVLAGNLLLEKKEEILNDVREQMQKGENANGGIIGSYANDSYKQKKLRMNPLANGNVDYHLTGRLYSNLDLVEQSETDFGIFSSVKYASYLAERFGIESFGLRDERQQYHKDEILFLLLESSLEDSYE